ncbi:hypothetical protein QUF88_12735 [Bacillus sp. DX1.1]|nr:hypothetical protein [Bacillus sp. DX3.1]MDM5154667.1 hypothetical protein [Bacillus sp. DX1.1]WJE83558.1 hypothetical protein QRE67_10230 [Bacillus sp. DX3.1]
MDLPLVVTCILQENGIEGYGMIGERLIIYIDLLYQRKIRD